MDLIKMWAIRIVAASVVVSFVLIISPGGALGKSLKTAISLFMLFTIIYPFFESSGLVENFDFSEEIVKPQNVDGGELIVEMLEKELSLKVEKLLTDNGLIVKDIEINSVIKKENEVAVESMNVVVSSISEMSPEEIRQLIIDNCGLYAEVEVTDDKQH